jgi:hypothetical protein
MTHESTQFFIAASAVAAVGIFLCFLWWMYREFKGLNTREHVQLPLRKMKRDLLDVAYGDRPEEWAAIRARGTISKHELCMAVARKMANKDAVPIDYNARVTL